MPALRVSVIINYSLAAHRHQTESVLAARRSPKWLRPAWPSSGRSTQLAACCSGGGYLKVIRRREVTRSEIAKKHKGQPKNKETQCTKNMVCFVFEIVISKPTPILSSATKQPISAEVEIQKKTAKPRTRVDG